MGFHTNIGVLKNCPASVKGDEFRVLQTLSTVVDDKTHAWWITIDELAKLGHMSRSTASRGMDKLVEVGYVLRIRKST